MKKFLPVIIGLVFIAGLVTVSCLIDKTPRLKQEETIPNEPNPDLADLTLDTYEIGINEVVDVMVSEEIFKVKLLNMYEEDIACPKGETCPFAYEIKITIEINGQIYNVNYNDNPSLKFGNTNNYLRFDRCYLGDKICFVVVPLIKGESYLVDNFVNRKLPVFEKKAYIMKKKLISIFRDTIII